MDVQQNLKLLQTENNQLMQQIDELNDSISEQQSLVATYMQKCQQLEMEKNQCLQKNQILIEDFQKLLQEEVEKQMQSFEQEKKQYREQEEQINRLQKDISKLQMEKSNAETQIESLKKSFQEFKQIFNQNQNLTDIDFDRIIEKNIQNFAKDADKVRKKKEQLNVLRQQMDKIIAENRILRTLAKVPENYGFDLTQIKLGEVKQIEDFKVKIFYLEQEVKELEAERVILRARLREISTLYNNKDSKASERYRDLDDQQMYEVDQFADKLRHGLNPLDDYSYQRDFFKREKEKLEKKIRELEEINARSNYQGGQIDQLQFNRLTNDIKMEINKILQDYRIQGIPVPQNQGPGDDNQNNFQNNQQRNNNFDTHNTQQFLTNSQKAPIPLHNNNFDEIKQGHSFRYDQNFNVDLNCLYSDGEFDIMKAKHEIAALQLQNLETIKLLTFKEDEARQFRCESENLKQELKFQIQLQDELFKQHFKQLDLSEKTKIKLEKESIIQKQTITELQWVKEYYGSMLEQIINGNEDAIKKQIAEMTKKTAILEINQIKICRQYQAQKDEYKTLKVSYDQQQYLNQEQQLELVEKIQTLVKWKAKAKGQLKTLLDIQNNQVQVDINEYKKLREKCQINNIKSTNEKLKKSSEAILQTRNQILYDELKGQRDKNFELEKECKEIEYEKEKLSLKLYKKDSEYKKFVDTYQSIVELILAKS